LLVGKHLFRPRTQLENIIRGRTTDGVVVGDLIGAGFDQFAGYVENSIFWNLSFVRANPCNSDRTSNLDSGSVGVGDLLFAFSEAVADRCCRIF